MQAYGRRKHDELEYRDLGAPSKHRRYKRGNRKKARRLLHKQGRNDSKKMIRNSPVAEYCIGTNQNTWFSV